MSSPLVSVVMTTHNRHTYLREAIDSILRQVMSDFEFIIVNDGSTNQKVLEILSDTEKMDSRVRLIHQDNQGLAAARNSGTRCASAPLIALMDDDDISHPDRLMVQADHLGRNANVCAVTTQIIPIDERGARMKFKRATQPLITSPVEPDFSAALEMVDKVILNPTTMVRKMTLEKVGGYRPWFRQIEDFDLTLRFMESAKIALIPDRLYYYREHRCQNRLSKQNEHWDYVAASVLSFHSRLTGNPDFIPFIPIKDVHAELGKLSAVGRRYLLLKARYQIRNYIRDNHREQLSLLWPKLKYLVQDDADQAALDRLKMKTVIWRMKYLRPWRL